MWWGDKPTQLHGVLKLPFLICASTSVLKISSNKHVFDRRHVFSCTTRLVVAEDNVKFRLVLGRAMGTNLQFVVTFACRQYRDFDSL